jgi:hypothetical protein
MRENGPAIYRWVNERKGITSPGVTEELVSRFSFAPFGAGSVRDTSSRAAIFSRACGAIFDRPCGIVTAQVALSPGGIGRLACLQLNVFRGWRDALPFFA